MFNMPGRFQSMIDDDVDDDDDDDGDGDGDGDGDDDVILATILNLGMTLLGGPFVSYPFLPHPQLRVVTFGAFYA